MALDWTEDELPFPLTAVDRAQLKLTDEEYEPHTWDQLRQIVAEHNLSILTRWPSDLKRYIRWSIDTRATYGTVPNFVRIERLKWDVLPSSTGATGPQFAVQNSIPFADPRDYKILINDWPYGYEPGIKHIIVWLKTRLETEPTKGDMTPKSRQQVEAFIQKTFVERIQDLPGDGDNVMWFKNWTALQSVPGIEHVHVFVRAVPDHIIEGWTGSDEPINNQTMHGN